MPLTWLVVAGVMVAASRVPRVGALASALVLFSLCRGTLLPAPTLHATVHHFALTVHEATRPGDRILVEDFPGILAWFSERDVLCGDGLAAGVGYAEVLERGHALAWWQARQPTYYGVTRRRAAWAAEAHDVDVIAPPFLAVPPVIVPIDSSRPLAQVTDPGSGRTFLLVPFGAGAR